MLAAVVPSAIYLGEEIQITREAFRARSDGTPSRATWSQVVLASLSTAGRGEDKTLVSKTHPLMVQTEVYRAWNPVALVKTAEGITT